MDSYEILKQVLHLSMGNNRICGLCGSHFSIQLIWSRVDSGVETVAPTGSSRYYSNPSSLFVRIAAAIVDGLPDLEQ